MRVAYFDCVGGASGDMLLGALADAANGYDAILTAVTVLNLPGCEVKFNRVTRGGISALQAIVQTSPQSGPRHVPELISVIEAADFSDSLKVRARQVLYRLAEVEAAIHNTPVESVHLHELGGDDTLVDIVGVLAGLEALAVDYVVVSPFPLGRGWVKSAHGPLPLPAPATLNLLKDAPVRYVDIEFELVTPTGAVLLTEIADDYGGFPAMTLHQVGSGAGGRDFLFPNILRLWLGESQTAPEGLIVENLVVLETNIDDMNPQIYEHVMHQLFAAGALDVTLTPQQMKKNRPGVLLTTLSRAEQADDLLSILFLETTTLGVRRRDVERVSLPRTIEEVETRFGRIRVKRVEWGQHVQRTPEYEDCRRAAKAHGVPMAEVLMVVSEVTERLES